MPVRQAWAVAVAALTILTTCRASIELAPASTDGNAHCRFCPSTQLVFLSVPQACLPTIAGTCGNCGRGNVYNPFAFDGSDGLDFQHVPVAFMDTHPQANAYSTKFTCEMSSGNRLRPKWRFDLSGCEREKYCLYNQTFPGQSIGTYRISFWIYRDQTVSALPINPASNGNMPSGTTVVTPLRRQCLAPNVLNNGNCLSTYSSKYCSSRSVAARYTAAFYTNQNYASLSAHDSWAHTDALGRHLSLWCQISNPTSQRLLDSDNTIDAPVSSVHTWFSGIDPFYSTFFSTFCQAGFQGSLSDGYAPLYGLPHGGPVVFSECNCDADAIGPTCAEARSTYCGTPTAQNGFNYCNNHGQCSITGRYLGTTECAQCTPAYLKLNMFCTCAAGSGWFGQFCENTCTKTVGSTTYYAHDACPANAHCVLQSDGVPKCQCDTGYHGQTPGGILSSCVTCTNFFNQPVPTCNGRGTCEAAGGQPRCQCSPELGYMGLGCEIQKEVLYFCGNLAAAGGLWPRCKVDPAFNPANTPPLDATYTCSFSGDLRIPSSSYGLPYGGAQDKWPVSFECGGINLFTGPTGSITYATGADACSRIKTECRQDMAGAIQASESLDLCPLPLIDLVSPYDGASPDSTTFCSVPANPRSTMVVPNPVPWVSSNFLGLATIYCYRLSTLVTGLSSGQTYRCKQAPSVTTFSLLCDLTLSRSDTVAMTTTPNSGLLLDRIRQTCMV